MLNLLLFEDAFNPFIFLAAILLVIIVVITVVARKAITSYKSSRPDDSSYEQNSSNPFTDGNGRTQRQRDYLNKKRAELAERKAKSDSSHTHVGVAEKYAPIVGSLGQTYDEGCEDLDGARYLEHDEAYCDEPDHSAKTDFSELERAIVLGEVINSPRFSNPYGKRK
ncbi:MAG: hypothetical protein NC099_00450 [Corallococcus sp.]|nr:hypothetical protein [Bacillota bacterium]MCM1533104.1 hypothetical protein [Corallococcus sp.]